MFRKIVPTEFNLEEGRVAVCNVYSGSVSYSLRDPAHFQYKELI